MKSLIIESQKSLALIESKGLTGVCRNLRPRKLSLRPKTSKTKITKAKTSKAKTTKTKTSKAKTINIFQGKAMFSFLNLQIIAG